MKNAINIIWWELLFSKFLFYYIQNIPVKSIFELVKIYKRKNLN